MGSRRRRVGRGLGWLLPLSAAALLAGCGSSGSTDSASTGTRVGPVAADGVPVAQARKEARAAASEFIEALAHRDAETYCIVLLPELQRPAFAETRAPAGDCEERAEALFAAFDDETSEPAWEALSNAKVGEAKPECAAGPKACARATVEVTDLPVRGARTTDATIPVSFVGGRWRLGRYWVEVESEPPSIAHRDPVAAAQGYLDALSEQDAKTFCELTSPEAQEATFSSNGDPAGGTCEERARTMFATPVEEGSEPLWLREARSLLGPINLHCIPGTEHCRTARIKIESLPLAGGGTSIAPMTLKFIGGRWRVGAVEPAPLGGPAEGADQT